MSDDVDMGPDEVVNLALIAKRYYVQRQTKSEIAREFGLSRFKIARMLDDALTDGIVSITIKSPGPIDPELSLELREHLGIARAIVVMADEQSVTSSMPELLAPTAAALLAEVVRENDVLGVTTGRTIQAIARRVSRLERCDVIQLTGVADPKIENGLEAVGRLAAASGGTGYSLYAPQVVSDVGVAEAFRREPSLQRTLARFDEVTIALVTIGSWSPPDSQMYDNFMNTREREELVARGVQAEVCATLLDRDGRKIQTVEDRSISITEKQLASVRDVIAVAGGPSKLVAIRAAALSGLITTLVTDSRTARAIVAARMPDSVEALT